MTWFAAGRFSPRPPALIEITSTDGPSVGRERRRSTLVALPRASAARGRTRPACRAARARCGTSRSKPGYCVKTSALSPAGTCSSSSTSRSSFPERPSSGCPVASSSSGWLQTCFSWLEHREHRRRAGRSVSLLLLDPRHPAVDRRLVEARLLDRQPAVVLLDRDRRQLELDLGRVLRAPQDERLHDRAQPLERALVAVHLDRPRERAVEPLARAEQPRVDDVHDRPQLAEPVLDRRARHRDAAPRRQPPQRARALRRRVLDVLRLVEQQPVPVDARERRRCRASRCRTT